MKTHILSILSLFLSAVITIGAEKPNVVFILADDLSAEYLSSYSNKGVNTPNIDSIGARGVKFKTAWATSVCGATRSLLMTGKFGNKTGYYHNNFSSFSNLNTDVNQHLTIGKMFKDSGYKTQYVGKWGIKGDINHYDDVMIWDLDIRTAGMEDAHTPSRYWHPAISHNGVVMNTTPQDFGPDIFQKQVLNFIQNQTEPFFVFYAMVAPHGVRDHKYPVIPNGVNGGLKSNYKSLVKYIDDQVGEILQSVDDNTIVVFCSDNATAREGKQENVERGCRVPFLICGGPIAQRGHTIQLFSFADILPTFADFSNYGEPIYSDGISVKSFLIGEYELTRTKMYSNIGSSILVTDGKYKVEALDKVRKNPKGDFYKRNRDRKPKGKIYSNLKRYAVYVGGSPLKKNSSIFKSQEGKRFVKFWIALGKREDRDHK